MRAAVTFFGMASTPVRSGQAEAALVGNPARRTDLADVAHAAAAANDPGDDIHGTAAFRRRIATHLTQRALTRALEEAAHA